MRNKIAVILFIVMIFSALAVGVNADAKPVLDVKKGTPVVDGVIDEVWDHVEEMKLDRMTTVGDASATGYSKLLWDDEHLYGLIVINDPTKSNETEALHTEDCLEVFFDLNNKKTETYAEKNQFRFLYDVISPLGLRNPENISENPLDYIGLAGSEPDGNTYIYEFSINYKIGIDFAFKAGIEIGIDVGFDDNTKGDNTRTAALSWNAEGNVSANPSLMGTIKLVDEEAMPPIIIEEAAPAPAEEAAAPVAAAPAAAVTAPATADFGLIFIGLLLVSAVIVKKIKI